MEVTRLSENARKPPEGIADRSKGFAASNTEEESHYKEGGEANPSACPFSGFPQCFNDLESVKYMEGNPKTFRSVSIKKSSSLTPEQQKQLLHKQHLLGHFGPDAIVKALKDKNVHWPNILKDATSVCRSCIQCLRYNISRKGYHPLTPIVASQPFDHLAIDLAGPYPTLPDKEHWLLVIIDINSRFVLLRSLRDKSSAEVGQTLLRVSLTLDSRASSSPTTAPSS